MDFHAEQILTSAFDESGDIVIELLHAGSEVPPEKLTLLTFRFRYARRGASRIRGGLGNRMPHLGVAASYSAFSSCL